MYERILVAVDGSDTSNLALQEATTLAKDQHSMSGQQREEVESVEAPTVIEYQNAQKVQGQKLLADCSASARAAGVEFDSKLHEALGVHIYDVIEEEAKRWPADLIVIGTHGRKGIRRLLLGSVAEGLIRISSKPVLLVRGA